MLSTRVGTKVTEAPPLTGPRQPPAEIHLKRSAGAFLDEPNDILHAGLNCGLLVPGVVLQCGCPFGLLWDPIRVSIRDPIWDPNQII